MLVESFNTFREESVIKSLMEPRIILQEFLKDLTDLLMKRVHGGIPGGFYNKILEVFVMKSTEELLMQFLQKLQMKSLKKILMKFLEKLLMQSIEEFVMETLEKFLKEFR